MANGHTITIEQGTERVRVVHGDQVLAESYRPLVLRETGCPVRYYLPAEDVRLDLLTTSDTHTLLPVQGRRLLLVPARRPRPRLVLSRPRKTDVARIKGHFCFYEVEVA